MHYLQIEHDIKMKIYQTELETKEMERIHRQKEHESSLRNLDSMYERYSGD